MQDQKRFLLGLSLLIARNHEGKVSKIRLMKYAFLLSHENCTVAAKIRYEFVPYHYGPFSFALYRDFGNLQRDGFFRSGNDEGEDQLEFVNSLQKEVRGEYEKLPLTLREGIFRIVHQYRSILLDDLLQKVYSEYPWYAMRSKRKDLLKTLPASKTPETLPAVFTLGYEGRTIDGFFALLLQSGIGRIIDVRKNPISHKYGFAGSSLKNIASKVEIDYRHFPDLGIPSSKRRNLDTPRAYHDLFGWYENEVRQHSPEAFSKVCDLLLDKPSVLLCAERDPRFCHRERLAKLIAPKTGLDICHLG